MQQSQLLKEALKQRRWSTENPGSVPLPLANDNLSCNHCHLSSTSQILSNLLGGNSNLKQTNRESVSKIDSAPHLELKPYNSNCKKVHKLCGLKQQKFILSQI